MTVVFNTNYAHKRIKDYDLHELINTIHNADSLNSILFKIDIASDALNDLKKELLHLLN